MDQEKLESFWVQLRSQSPPQNICITILAVVYHSTANGEEENVTLHDYMQKKMDTYLSKHKEENRLQPACALTLFLDLIT